VSGIRAFAALPGTPPSWAGPRAEPERAL